MDANTKVARKRGERDEQKALSASGRRLRAQGHRTRELVVQEAKKLLLECGSLEFTLRTVARRAHISISNLQYYFPTRASLLRAIMEPVLTRYKAQLDRPVDDPATARQLLLALVDQTLADGRSPEVSAIWLHFGSLAVTDPESARLLDESYADLTRGIGRLMRIINPSLSARDSQLLARITSAMADGLVFQIGAGHRAKDSVSGLDARVREATMLLVERLSGATR